MVIAAMSDSPAAQAGRGRIVGSSWLKPRSGKPAEGRLSAVLDRACSPAKAGGKRGVGWKPTDCFSKPPRCREAITSSSARHAGRGESRTPVGHIPGCGISPACRKIWFCIWLATSGEGRSAGKRGSNTPAGCWGTRTFRRLSDTCTWTIRNWRTRKI